MKNNSLTSLRYQVRKSALAQIRSSFQQFFHTEAASGVVLILFAVAALIWANSPWGSTYTSLWQTKLTIGWGDFALSKAIILWINDGLMAIFFFVVGLEIKREILSGELSSLKKASLPIAAAIGGMAVPALIYTALNIGQTGSAGWGIPMATDIAFALGILALLGKRVPLSLKIFLTAVAIVDDIGAVLVIALFYTAKLSLLSLGIGAGILLLLFVANRINLRHPLIYIVLGIALWVAILKSGIHATIAGVLLAMTIPAGSTKGDDGHSLLHRMEHALHPWVAYAIMPVFALANAGVVLAGESAISVAHPVTLGIIAGLLLGKQGGIMLAVWLMLRTNLTEKPADMSWRHIYGVSWLAGIGFTMSLFITGLAFTDAAILTAAKVGILIASLIAGVIGWSVLRLSTVNLTQYSKKNQSQVQLGA